VEEQVPLPCIRTGENIDSAGDVWG